jgi:hypothetical protein
MHDDRQERGTGTVVVRKKQHCGLGGGECSHASVYGGLRDFYTMQSLMLSCRKKWMSMSDYRWRSMSTVACAIAGGHGEIDGPISTLRSPHSFCLNSSEDEVKVAAWIWETSY